MTTEADELIKKWLVLSTPDAVIGISDGRLLTFRDIRLLIERQAAELQTCHDAIRQDTVEIERLAAEIAALREDERATRKQWCGRDFDHLPLPDAVGASMKVATMCHEAEVWALREKIARAAAAPPRVPTREMLHAVHALGACGDYSLFWRAMWDAAPVAMAAAAPPREPTQAMVLAGVNAVSVTGSDYGNTFRRQKTPLVQQAKRDDVVQTWRAMYDAAPVAAPAPSVDNAALWAQVDADKAGDPVAAIDHAIARARGTHGGEAARPRPTDAPMTDALQLLDDLAEWDMFTGSGKVADAEYWLRRINAVRAGRASVAQSTA